MKKQEIKKQIDNAVRIFRETLEATFLEKNDPLYAIGVHNFLDFFTGEISETRKSNGNLRISGEVAKAAFSERCKGVPTKFEDWAIYPIVIALFNEDVGEKEK